MRSSILPRQAFKVTYVRRGDSQTWSGSVDLGEVFRETEASGVVGYGTYLWRGMAPAEEHFAVVTVLIPCDPCLFERGVAADPFIQDSMAVYARMLADAAVLGRHPGARIEVAAAGTAAVARPVAVAAGRKILIVEDSGPTRMALSGIFRRRGWQVSEAETLTQGLALLEPPPDLAVIDLTLPDGDGEDVVRAIRSRGLPTSIAVCTGSADSARIDAVRSLGPEGVFSKPLNIDAIVAVCR